MDPALLIALISALSAIAISIITHIRKSKCTKSGVEIDMVPDAKDLAGDTSSPHTRGTLV